MQLKVNKIRNREEKRGMLGGQKISIEYRLRLRLELSPDERQAMELWGPDEWTMAEWQTGYASNPDEHSISLRQVLDGWEERMEDPELGEIIATQVRDNARLFKERLTLRAEYDGELVIDI